MSNFRLGAHTYVFSQYGFDFSNEVSTLFGLVKDSGFDWIELHPVFVTEPGWKAKIEAAIERTGLTVVGVSYGQPLWNIEAHDRILREAEDFTDRVAQLGTLNCGLTCGGKRCADRTDAENEQAVRMWREMGELYRSKGLALNYHTHGEPIEDIRLVLDNVPAELVALGPDLDWLRVGGVDPLQFIKDHAERITMLHLRDYHIGGDRTEALGEGDADYAELARILEETGFDGDGVVELALPQGKDPVRPVDELLRISREHLRETMAI